MKKSITLRAFPPAMATLERCALAKRAGYDAVELNLERGLDISPTSSERQLLSLRRAVDDMGLGLSSIYSREQWSYCISTADPPRRQQGMDIIRRLIQVGHLLGIKVVLVIPGAVDDSLFGKEPEIVRYDVAYRRVQEALAELLPMAAAAGLTLAIENVPNKLLLSPLEMARFVDELASPALGIYFDVANAMLNGFPEHWIEILGERIKGVHVKDYRRDIGGLRGFTGLLQGDVDWPAVVAAFHHIGYDGYITSEVLPPYKHHGERLINETSAAISAIFGLD
ncbi:MAG: sugar phosphate isomerase/epimerase [Chloroflexi bacterium]|nr:sugar phosphate isomerase/epimerase [Chloroflexota bacterium]